MSEEQQAIKPQKAWVLFLCKPRETIRQVLAYNPLYGVFVISSGLLTSAILSSLVTPRKPDDLPLPIEIGFFVILMLIIFPLAIGITQLMGHLLGVQTNLRISIAANIWPMLPQVYINMLLLPCYYLLDPLHPLILCINAVTCIYTTILLGVCISEALSLSLKKAWLIMVVQIFAMIGLLLALFFLIVFALRG